MVNKKPFVALACFCEQLLREQDGVVSAIRIVDTYILPPLPPDATVPPESIRGSILLKGLVAIKSDTPMDGEIHLVMHKTTGETSVISPPEGWPVQLKGDESGANILIQMPLGVKHFGLVWFDVLWGDEILTRMPLMLRQGEAAAVPIPESSRSEDGH